MIIGLDVGGSTTKLVAFERSSLHGLAQVKAGDPLTSAFGGFGRLLEQNHLMLKDVELIKATGVGAAFLPGELFGVRVALVPEFGAVGLGGLFLSQLNEAIVVSMGTGTSIVKAKAGKTEHVIGSGIGGGTLLGLSRSMLNTDDFKLLSELAEAGELDKIDLSIGDIAGRDLPGLPLDTTASNFGKLDSLATREDLALGIVNLVFQSVATNAILASRLYGLNDIIFTGSLTMIPSCRQVLDRFSQLYRMRICIPENAEFATAIGCALSSDGDSYHDFIKEKELE